MITEHRAFGVYGIIYQADQGLVVIRKKDGPYQNRYDLPGGSLENGETLSQTLGREIQEETGLKVINTRQVGTTSFRYPWAYQHYRYNQHVTVFYDIVQFQGEILNIVADFAGQDSAGALYRPLSQLTEKNSSPLVLKAKEYLLADRYFDPTDTTLNTWQVLSERVD